MTSLPHLIAAFVVTVCVLVAVHELGHYAVARLLNIKVLRFSIGFGRPLWRRIGRNGTEFVLAVIPLGGYVKMLDEREGPVPEADRPFAFNRQSIPRRAAVLAAGPAFNLAFAIAAYWIVFVLGVPGLRPVLGDVDPGTPAAAAGLASGDEILAIGGARTTTWDGALLKILDEMLDDGSIPMRVRSEAGAEREVVLDVGDRVEALTEPGALLPGLGLSVWSPPLPPRLGELAEGGAADRAGLRTGDLILAADGSEVADWEAWRQYVRARPGETVQVRVERDGRAVDVALAIGVHDEDGTRVGRIDAAPQAPPDFGAELRAEQRYGPLEAGRVAVVKTWDMSVLTLRMFWKMLWGEVSVRNISGPINIAQFADFSASGGIVPFLSFLAIVSVSLGLINLLPIPLLDGGQLLYAGIEAIKGSPLSQRAELIGQQLGVALLLALMSVAFYNDIARLVE
jgi:regulator of sigma E protease